MPGGESIAREAAAQAEGEVEDAVEEVDRERGIPPGILVWTWAWADQSMAGLHCVWVCRSSHHRRQ